MRGGEAAAGAPAGMRRRLRLLMAARLAISVGVFGVALVLLGAGREGAELAERGTYGTIAVAFLATAVYAASFGRVGRPERFGALQLVTDVSIVTSLVYFSGGADSIFGFLYLPVVVYGAVLFDRRGAYGAAAAASAAYGAVLVAGSAPLGPPLARAAPSPEALFAQWVVQTGALLLVGLLSSALSRELRATGEALEESAIDLRRLRRLHERTVESLTSGLLTTDPEGRITSFNPEAERITGLSAQGALGKPLEEVIPGASAFGLRAPGPSEPPSSQRWRLPFVNAKGEERHLGLSSSVLREVDGTGSGRVVIFQDVTDVVAMERDLRRNERLAGVGQLAADIAHEIRNPLAAISGSVEMLRAGLRGSEKDAEGGRLMGIVLREIERMDGLITDFLQYARPGPPKTVPVDLAAAVGEVASMFEGRGREGVVLESRVPEGLAVLADPAQTRQILWNLVLNAADAMPEGGRVRIEARVAERPQGELPEGRKGAEEGPPDVEIEVRDEGEGIPAEVMERIFDPFFTTKRDGTGLGLATVHRIVEGHGGSLRVESRAGEGTCFRVHLARAEEQP